MTDIAQNSFADITARLDEIIASVRSKDTSLERSLDLYDEAIKLASRAAELVDSFDMSPEEAAQLEEAARDEADDGAVATVDSARPSEASPSDEDRGA